MALPVASSTQSQKESPRWPPQTAPASPRAALPRPTPRNPVTDEDCREHLAELGAATERFEAEKCKIGRPRECEIAAPKHQDYTAEDFERAQRYYRKYHNAWRNFHSAKLRLAEASAQDKGRLQKLTLKNAELLKHGKEDYLSFDRTRLPLRSGASPEQRQKRLILLRKKLEDSRQKISKTEEFLSLGKITPEEAAASLQRQNHWKSKMGGEIADIDFEIQHESVLPNDGQLACGNAGIGNIPPADASLLSLEDSSDHFTNSISDSTNGYQDFPAKTSPTTFPRTMVLILSLVATGYNSCLIHMFVHRISPSVQMLHVSDGLGLRQRWVSPHQVSFLENAIISFARSAA
ncbi:hypothetical protein LA080_011674 [Diaporthe eres]|nr:hypothetical protein LA080_011674 [Diaporthe eres]